MLSLRLPRSGELRIRVPFLGRLNQGKPTGTPHVVVFFGGSSSKEVRMMVSTSFSVYFSRGTLPQKRGEKGTTGGPSCKTHQKGLYQLQ